MMHCPGLGHRVVFAADALERVIIRRQHDLNVSPRLKTATERLLVTHEIIGFTARQSFQLIHGYLGRVREQLHLSSNDDNTVDFP